MANIDKIKNGVLWNSLQQFGQLGINFLSTILLARFLAPEEYGIYGVLIIFVSISEMLSDSGIAGYIIKKQDVSSIYYDTLFVYNVSIGIVMYLILFLVAPLIAKFYEDEMLTSAIRILGLVILLYAFSITQYTRLLKNLQFKRIAVINIISGSIALCIALYLAYMKQGIWALIYQQLLFVLLTTVGYLIANRHIPHFRFNFQVFKEQFGFGINLFCSSILDVIVNNVNNNVVAKLFNMNIAGLYTQAARLQNYPLSMISNVVDKTFFPVFSKMNNNWALLQNRICQLRKQLYAILFPLFSAIICFSYPIVYILLGKKWLHCIPYFQILMLASFPLLIKVLNRNVLKSLGYVKTIFKIEFYSALVFSVCLLACFLLKDVWVFLIAIVLSKAFSAVFGMLCIEKLTNMRFKQQIYDVLLFLPCAIVPAISQYFMPNLLILKISIYIISLFFFAVLYSFIGCKEYLQLYGIIKCKFWS